MSAFICSDMHIATIAFFASNGEEKTMQDVADFLKRENIRSVNFRYKEKTKFKACDITQAKIMDPADIVALCDCLDYQSCEHPDYQRGMIKVIRNYAMALSGGNKSNIWSI